MEDDSIGETLNKACELMKQCSWSVDSFDICSMRTRPIQLASNVCRTLEHLQDECHEDRLPADRRRNLQRVIQDVCRVFHSAPARFSQSPGFCQGFIELMSELVDEHLHRTARIDISQNDDHLDGTWLATIRAEATRQQWGRSNP
jgi:hypothetical protein